MTGFGVDANERRAFADLHGLQTRGEFETVSRHDAIVGVGCSDQRRRIAYVRFQVVIRRIRVDGFEFIRVVARAVIVRPVPPRGEFLETLYGLR